MSSGIDNGLCFIYFLSTGQNLNPRKESIGKSSLWHREHGGTWSGEPLLCDGFVGSFFFSLE